MSHSLNILIINECLTLIYTFSNENAGIFDTFSGSKKGKFDTFSEIGTIGGSGRLEFAGDFVKGDGHEGGFAVGGAVGDFAAEQLGEQGNG